MEENIKQLLADANSAFREEDFTAAEKMYLSVLESDPNATSAHYGLGTIALQNKDYSFAITALGKALQLEPEAADVAYNLSVALAQAGRHKDALIVAQQATRYCKDDPVICSRLAMLFHDLGEPQAAIQLLLRLKTLVPQDQIVLARSNGQLRNWQEAVSILHRLCEALPDEAQVANELAVAAGRLRDFNIAIPAYEQYLKLVRPSVSDYIRFATLLLNAQNPVRCEQAIKLAFESGDDNPQIYLLKAKLEAQLKGDVIAANKALDQTFERAPSSAQAWAMRAELAPKESLAEDVERLQGLLVDMSDMTIEQAKTPQNLQHRAQLHYSIGAMQARASLHDQAAASWKQANLTQRDLLKMNAGAYSTEQTENHINGLINDFSLEAFDKPGARVDTSADAKQPIFIVGNLRSGTSLVERIIGQNKAVFSAGEQESMELVANDFMRHRMSGKIAKPVTVSVDQWAAMRADYLKKLPQISQTIFTDKLPHNFRHVGVILKLFPNAKIIQVRRNIQDVCLSIYANSFTRSHNYANRWQDLSHFYRQSEKLMNHWSGLNSPRILDLSYENLVENPSYYGKQLVEFCGLEWSEACLNFDKTLNENFTFSEPIVRQAITSSRVGRWKLYQDHFPELIDL